MIVFDLSCDHGHPFEGWFGSSADFADQQARGLLICPQCGSETIAKAPMAPAVSAKGNRSVHKDVETGSSVPERSTAVANTALLDLPEELKPKLKAAIKAFAKAQSKALTKSEWVGDKFAETSRQIHYGEADEKPIHGQASAKQAEELLEEGIAIAPIIVPFTPPDELN